MKVKLHAHFILPVTSYSELFNPSAVKHSFKWSGIGKSASFISFVPSSISISAHGKNKQDERDIVLLHFFPPCMTRAPLPIVAGEEGQTDPG